MAFGGKKKDDKVALVGKVDHYKLTKRGGWRLDRETTDEYALSGFSNETAGRVKVTVVLDRKTGQVKKTEAKYDDNGESATVAGGKIRIGGAVVLNAVNAQGQTLARKAVIYNEFTV